MADATQFDHDRIGHLLADRLLSVPRFQRRYSWDESNVAEYLSDLLTASKKERSYFLGTIVLADDAASTDGRQIIVDGQQRLATTAILLVAIRDLLREYGRTTPADHVHATYLRSYDMKADEEVERLVLSRADQQDYEQLLNGYDIVRKDSPLRGAYTTCMNHLRQMCPASEDFQVLVSLVSQLAENVQVLVAVANDLPEAYVIFETLNDRGADLTTADLLKNCLFSGAGSYFKEVEERWIEVESAFEHRPEDLVKFIRYDFVSLRGKTSTRKLYREIQAGIGNTPGAVRDYMRALRDSLDVYLALRDPDSTWWNSVDVDVRDSLLAFRRFGFESSFPLILAAFREWDRVKAAELLVKIANWTIRALFAGRIGASLSEEVFADAAKKLSEGNAKKQADVRESLDRLVPSDKEFAQYFIGFGDVPSPRAKYLLGTLERAERIKNSKGVEALPDWSSKGVTIEHLQPRASKKSDQAAATWVERLGNMALLERGINRGLDSKPFEEKRVKYGDSSFELTRKLSEERSWGAEAAQARSEYLAKLAVLAWPDR